MRCTSLYKYETKKQQCNNNNGILLDGILFKINTKKYYSTKVLFVSHLLRSKYIDGTIPTSKAKEMAKMYHFTFYMYHLHLECKISHIFSMHLS